jgi:hypothetical protein
MTTSTDFVVKRSNLCDAKFVDTQLPELRPGQVLLDVDKFALTANNVTYGVAGDTIGYWRFFSISQCGPWLLAKKCFPKTDIRPSRAIGKNSPKGETTRWR